MKYRAIKDNVVEDKYCLSLFLKADTILMLKAEYYRLLDNPQCYIPRSNIEDNPNWEVYDAPVSISVSEADATPESSRKWKMEMEFECTPSQAEKFKRQAENVLNDLFLSLRIPLRESHR